MTKARDLGDNAQNTKPKVVDAKGDLIVGTGADAAGRLAVASTAGYLLSVDSGETTGLKWAAPATGGMTSLATGTLSGSQVDLTSISGSYNDLVLVIRNYRPNTDGQPLRMRLNADTGTSYITTSYNTADLSEVSFNSTVLTLSGSVDSTTNNGNISVTLMDYANAVTWKMANVFSLGSGDATVTNVSSRKSFLLSNISAAITEINLFPASGTFNGGTYILYGVK